MRFAVTFPTQTIEVDAADPQEAACAAAYELARQCESAGVAAIVTADRIEFDAPETSPAAKGVQRASA